MDQATSLQDGMHLPALARKRRWARPARCLSIVACVTFVWILYTIYTTALPAHVQGQRQLFSISSESIISKDVLVSTISVSRVHSNPKSESNYIANLRFGHELLTDGKPLLTGPPLFQPNRKKYEEVQEFLARDHLIQTPFDTDIRSPYLTTTPDVIAEAQRIHLNMFTDLLRGKKYALLFQMPNHENKGDSAIAVGEMMLLERMGIQLLLCQDNSQNKEEDYQQALTIAQRYPQQEVAVLLHGGGNIFGYHLADTLRAAALRHFSNYTAILFPQSIRMSGTRRNFQVCQKLYCCNPNLTIILRDKLSLQIAQRIFNGGTRLLLAPDMAFQLGALNRHSPPFYDVSWLKRLDGEKPQYSDLPKDLLPKNLTLWTWDWVHFPSFAAGNIPMRMVNILESGLSMLQRGRVVVTDRLHGHILCTLLDIPHVLLDNPDHKLSSYYNTWTRGLAICRLASSTQEAAGLALELLQKFQDVLPQRITGADKKPYI